MAATTPAPYFISPCVSVGPSSTTRTRLPRICSAPSTEIGEAASITTAPGFSSRIERRTASMPSGSAVSILLITTTSARRRFASPGW